jgi:hypothetical protein
MPEKAQAPKGPLKARREELPLEPSRAMPALAPALAP